MQCMYCQNGIGHNLTLYLVPDADDGGWSCLPCAKENGIYCDRHGILHTWFSRLEYGAVGSPPSDRDHACLQCIDAVVDATDAGVAADYDRRVRATIPPEQQQELDDWVESVSFTGDGVTSLLRAVATMAARRRSTLDDVVADVEVRHSVTHLLPGLFM